jgi:serine/threonine protein kinase
MSFPGENPESIGPADASYEASRERTINCSSTSNASFGPEPPTVRGDLHATGAQQTSADEPTGRAGADAASSRSPLELTPGQMFGRYRVMCELGRGGMGAVFLAVDTHLDRKVALKVPSFRFGATEELIARFYREARSMATLHHPNICPIYDVGEIDGQLFLSMAFIDGRSLSQAMREGTGMAVHTAARWMHAIAMAVQKAHEAGVIHRDLKPSNVMLTLDGEPVVMDFGLARRSKSSESDLTQTGLMLGSPAYMPPEQVEARHHEIGPWTDVWALGVMLFELLTGHRPFKGSSAAAILGRIVESEPQTFSDVRCMAPPALEAICRKALSKDIGARCQSAREFADQLVRFTSPTVSSTSAVVVPPQPANVEPDKEPSGSQRKRGSESRQVTIAVFNFELDGSTTGDVEAGNEMALAFRQFVSSRVKQHGGAMMTSSGQEVLACFGYPLAHEDSPQRAIHAALLVVNDAAKLESGKSRDIPPAETIWATVHTGEAVAEDANEWENSVTVTGEVRTTVLRLDGMGVPGSVVISAATRQRSGLVFETESLGIQRIRGVPQPVELFRVVKEIT